MEKLQAELNGLLSHLSNATEIKDRLETLISIYPFNEYEYLISVLLGAGVLNLDDYFILRDEYIARNLYLPIVRTLFEKLQVSSAKVRQSTRRLL